MRIPVMSRLVGMMVAAATLTLVLTSAAPAAESPAKEILKAAGKDAGLCIVLGAGSKSSPGLAADLASESRLLVHGLALDDEALAAARKAIEAKGLMGRATVERADLAPLPYVRDIANMIVIEDPAAIEKAGVTAAEIQRVTAPGGLVCTLKGGKWTSVAKARPKEMDDWTHPAHGADGSRVSADKLVQFPVGLRWQDGVPMNFNLWAACRAYIVAGGRCFTLSTTELENIGPASFSKHKAEEYVLARDAYNGLPLWKVNCETTNDGKALNSRNASPMVTDGRRVYVYKKDTLVGLDAATGAVAKTYAVKHKTARLILLDGVLIASGWEGVKADGLWDAWTVKTAVGTTDAFDADSGRTLWSIPEASQELVAADGMAVMVLPPPSADKERALVCVELKTGKEKWRVPGSKLSDEADLRISGIGAGVVAVCQPKAKIVSVFSTDDGKPLWEVKPGDKTWTPIMDGFVIYGNEKRDPKTGEKKGNLPFGLDSPGCTPETIANNVLTRSRGCDYTDASAADPQKRNVRFGGARGACIEGSIPANGMFYTAQNFCRCAPGQVEGFIAFGPSEGVPTPADFEKARPVEKGPAFGAVKDEEPLSPATDWPMFLHDPARSGAAPIAIPAKLKVLWQTPVAKPAEGPLADAWKATLVPCLTAPVVAGKKVFTGTVDGGQVVALNAETGKPAWNAAVGGRVDTPPTVHAGMALVGSHDGWVYAFRAKDGQLAWRTRAAPADRRMVSFGQLESIWPVTGSVMVHEGLAYATAGRTTEADGGLAVVALDPATGQPTWAKGIAPGPNRENDLPAVRDGKVAVHLVRFDPKSGQSQNATLPKGVEDPLESIADGTWTRIGTRRSGGQMIGHAKAEMFVFNDKNLFGYECGGRAVFCITREVAEAKDKEKIEAKDHAWRLGMNAGYQAEAMTLGYGGLVVAGRAVDEKTGAVTGFLWVVSPDDGHKITELALDAPPVFHGIAVAGEKVYISLQNGSVVCFGKAE